MGAGPLARVRKPHGTKGDVAVWSLVDNLGQELQPGRTVWLVTEGGEALAGPVTIARRRRYHREWLVSFRETQERSELERWRQALIVPHA